MFETSYLYSSVCAFLSYFLQRKAKKKKWQYGLYNGKMIRFTEDGDIILM